MSETAISLGIDVGKTGLRVGVFDADLALVERWSVSTADVDGAQQQMEAKLREVQGRFAIGSVGISIFGPLEVDAGRPEYGAVVESSEPAWSGVNLPRQVSACLQQEVFFDFDVKAGALAEAMRGGARGRANFVYLSVGTGIGAVYFSNARKAGYAPQLGHMFLPREEDDLAFAGSCRFHGACLQGLASGKAMSERWGAAPEALEAGHRAWDLEARYVARACANLIYAFSPEVILLGSSVGASPNLDLAEVNRYMRGMLNDFMEPALRVAYGQRPAVAAAVLGADCSLVGAALLGKCEAGLRLRAPSV